MPSQRSVPPRPKLFVGSSTEGRRVAQLLAAGLADLAEVTLWCQGVFTPPLAARDGLVDATREFDFAAFVMAPDEIAPRRTGVRGAARDGVALQLGVFLGALGRQRTFIVCSTAVTVDLPSDLRGVTMAPYRPSGDGDLKAALGCSCAIVREQIRRLTPAVAPAQAASQVARRRRREALGTACTVGPKRVLRIADISLTGALLETFGEIPEGQLLDLDLTLDDGARVRVTAKVVRVQHPQWGKMGGVGVAFLRFEGESHAVLERYIDAEPGRVADPAPDLVSPSDVPA
jgi:hypothetical protein